MQHARGNRNIMGNDKVKEACNVECYRNPAPCKCIGAYEKIRALLDILEANAKDLKSSPCGVWKTFGPTSITYNMISREAKISIWGNHIFGCGDPDKNPAETAFEEDTVRRIRALYCSNASPNGLDLALYVQKEHVVLPLIPDGGNIIIYGKPGTGKSHLAQSLRARAHAHRIPTDVLDINYLGSASPKVRPPWALDHTYLSIITWQETKTTGLPKGSTVALDEADVVIRTIGITKEGAIEWVVTKSRENTMQTGFFPIPAMETTGI